MSLNLQCNTACKGPHQVSFIRPGSQQVALSANHVPDSVLGACKQDPQISAPTLLEFTF